MAARGAPPSVSMTGYGAGGSGDPPRPRSRNRSAGGSGPSSMEQSIERRGGGDRRRGMDVRGSGDFGGSYHNQNSQGPMFEQSRKASGQNLGYGRDRGKNRDLYWRDESRGVHGRVQGVFYDDDGSVGNGGSSSNRGYSLTISESNPDDGQGRRVPSAHQRQDDSHGPNRKPSNGHDRQENGHPVSQRPGTARGGFEGPGGYGRSSQSAGYRGRAVSVERRGGASRVIPAREPGVSRDGVFGDDRELGTFGSSGSLGRRKEAVFGAGKQLETFGSPRSLSRSRNSPRSLLPPAVEDGKRRWAKNGAETGRGVGGTAVKLLKEGDLTRKGFAGENVGSGDGRRSSTSSNSSNGSRSSGNRDRTVVKKEYKEDAFAMSGYERSSSYKRTSSIERMSDFSGELALVSPSSSSKRTLGRKDSYRVKNREASDQLPVFSPSSDGKADVRRGSSTGRLSRESSSKLSRESSISESTPRDIGLDGNEGLDAAKQQLPGTASESASAGMHRTRSTDWYEICLKEEEEEEMRARAREQEEESTRGSIRKPTQTGVSSFSRSSSSHQKRGESDVFSPSSVSGGNYRLARNLDKGWSQERIVRGDATDSAQLNLSSGQRNADAGVKQGLFTPWNALQSVPAVRNVSFGASRPKPVEPLRDSSSLVKHENLRVSIAGGRQESRGRRSVNATDSDGAGNWRAERRPSRDHSREVIVRSDSPREFRGREFPKQANERRVIAVLPDEVENWRAERRQSRDFSREIVVRSDPSREAKAGPSGRALPKQTYEKEGGAILASFVKTDKRASEVFLKTVNAASIRPATFYRALQEAMAGDDELLPHIVGTCPDMCPGKERAQRERLRDLAVFERVSGDMRRTSKDLAVKKFCRTVVASELESTDVRPLPVLWKTQQYLLGLLDDPEFSFDIVHNFLFDRTRAIRQELGMQRILDYQAITIHEEIVRFHILSDHELRDLNRKRSKQLDTHLNLQQLSKSLYSLLNLYISLGGKDGAHFENEAEFHAYYVLLNLGNHGRFQAEPLSLWFPNVPTHVLHGAPMQFARKALRFYRSKNFIAFFRLVREATYMQACLMELSFDSVRAIALAMLNIAEYKLHPYPLSDLAQQLILAENEVDELCTYYGLLTGIDNASEKPCLLAKQGQFSVPDKDRVPRHSCPLIDGKRAASFFQEVKGSKIN